MSGPGLNDIDLTRLKVGETGSEARAALMLHACVQFERFGLTDSASAYCMHRSVHCVRVFFFLFWSEECSGFSLNNSLLDDLLLSLAQV